MPTPTLELLGFSLAGKGASDDGGGGGGGGDVS